MNDYLDDGDLWEQSRETRRFRHINHDSEE